MGEKIYRPGGSNYLAVFQSGTLGDEPLGQSPGSTGGTLGDKRLGQSFTISDTGTLGDKTGISVMFSLGYQACSG